MAQTVTEAGWGDPSAALRKLSVTAHPHWANYYGFYSSWLGGYFREPWAMLLPLDDHGFHRGDGVFEAARIYEGAYFDLRAHLERLKRSAAAIGIELPMDLAAIEGVCVQLAKLCAVDAAVLRLYVTRGPGGFSPSPREVVGHQVYAALTKFTAIDPKVYAAGVTAMISTVEAKEPFWSQIKSCNYLQNVMMKRECLERGFDFAICVDHAGVLCEGSTENIMVITADGELVVPKFDYTLRGTTVNIVMKLAESLVSAGALKAVRLGDLHREDLRTAREAAFVGTTLGVLPIRSVDNTPIGAGGGGEISLQLHARLMEVIGGDAKLRTAF